MRMWKICLSKMLVFYLILQLVNAPLLAQKSSIDSLQNAPPFSQKKERQITAFLEEKQAYYNLPSIAVGSSDDQCTLYLNHVVNAEEGDRYIIGSCTKSFTALMILKLQEQGLLTVHDKVADHLEWFKYQDEAASDQITIRNLLNHTSGINTKLGRLFSQNKSLDYKEFYSKELGELVPSKSDNHPYEYSNVNYNLLGFVIEEVTGRSYEENLEELIIKPLALRATSAYDNQVDQLIKSYQYFLYHPILKAELWVHPHDVPMGGIASTAGDMARYLRQWLKSYNQGDSLFLSNQSLNDIFTPNDEIGSTYGYGWHIKETNEGFKEIWHIGRMKGFEAHMCLIPEHKKGVVVLINTNDAHASEIADGIIDLLLDKQPRQQSSFSFYRAGPFIPFALFLILLFPLYKWKQRNFRVRFSKRILPNLLLFIAILACVFLFGMVTKQGGSTGIKDLLTFEPSTGYSAIGIFSFLILISVVGYLNYKSRSRRAKIYSHFFFLGK